MAVVAWGALFYGNGFYLTALASQHGWSPTLISSGISVSFMACIPASLVVGWLIDRHGGQEGWGTLTVVVYGTLAMSLGVILLGRIQEPWQLFAVYLLLGSAYPALAAPAISATLNQRVRSRYGLALSFALTGASVGGIVSAPLLVWSSAEHGFASAMTGLGIVILTILLPVALWILWPRALTRVSRGIESPSVADTRAAPTEQGKLLRAALRSRAFYLILLASFLSLAAQVGFLAHQLSVLSGSLVPAQAAWLVSATAAASVAGRFLLGWLSERAPTKWLAAGIYLVQAAGIAIVSGATTAVGLFTGSVVAGLFVGAVVMLPPMLCRENFASEIYGRIYGAAAIGVYLGGGAGPSLTAWWLGASGSYSHALLVLVAVSTCAAFAVLCLPSRGPSPG